MEHENLTYTFSLIRQNKYRFYSLTLPSQILSEMTFVSSRYEDPEEGFQRLLNKKRAQEIANYLDSGVSTIPSAVILSAQPEAELEVIQKGRSLKFKKHPKAFMILDGQHRVYGYKLAESELRVPVIIYNGLSRREETRLFIDINTKQRPVPKELLLDIKHLADIETDFEELLRNLFDLLNKEKNSSLLGKLSPSEKVRGKINRTTFNSSFKTISTLITTKSPDELYPIFNSYFYAVIERLSKVDSNLSITNPILFKSIVLLFTDVASKVKDKGGDYNRDNFYDVLEPALNKSHRAKLLKPGNAYKDLYTYLSNSLVKNFEL
jgi:DGQHR domain-containing protein